MRHNLYELLARRQFDVEKEFAALWSLFCVEKCHYVGYGGYPMVSWVDEKVFRRLPFRGSFTSIKEMMSEFGLEARTFVNVEKLLLFCELIVAVLPPQGVAYDSNVAGQRRTILGNISYILEQTNHEWMRKPDGSCIVVEKNKKASMAAQLVADETVALELIEYNHFAIKGHLAEKKAILVSVAGYIEPILNSKALSSAGYKKIENDAKFVFNNFHIRHNNKEGSKANDYIATVNDKDLEEWYDKAYELALAVIIINDYLSVEKDVEDIKPKYAWRI